MDTGLTSLLAVLGVPSGLSQGGAAKGNGIDGLLPIDTQTALGLVGNNGQPAPAAAFNDIISLLLNEGNTAPLPTDASNFLSSLSQLVSANTITDNHGLAALPDRQALLDEFPGLASLIPPHPVAAAVPVTNPIVTPAPVVEAPVQTPVAPQVTPPSPYHSLVALNEVPLADMSSDVPSANPPSASQPVADIVSQLSDLLKSAAPVDHEELQQAVAKLSAAATTAPTAATTAPAQQPVPVPAASLPTPASPQKETVSNKGQAIDDAELLAAATDTSRPNVPALQNAIVQPVAAAPAENGKDHRKAAKELFQPSGNTEPAHDDSAPLPTADQPDRTTSTANNNNPAPTTADTTSLREVSSPVVTRYLPAAPNVVDQVVVKIVHLGKENGGKIEMKLEPAELGKIEIRMHFSREGHAQIAIRAERPETLELLQKDSRNLERALADSGLKTDSGSLSFDLRGGNDAWKQHQYSEQQKGIYTHVAAEEHKAPVEEVTRAQHAYYYVSSLGTINGVDIHV